MSTGAFLGDARVREQALERLGVHCAQGRINGGALFWSVGHGSAAGALIESSDPLEWQRQLGLAPWLAFAVDAAVGGLPGDDVPSAVSSLLHAIPLGIATSHIGNLLVVAVLDRHIASLMAAGTAGAPLFPAVEALRVLHQRASRGEAIAPAAWRTVRAATVLATDQAEDPALRALATCVEACAWDPVAAPATAGEALRAWTGYQAQLKVDAFGWTPRDHEKVQQLLDLMHETYILDRQEETRDVFMLLAEHHPAVEARLRAFGECGVAARTQVCKEAVQLLEAALRSASAERVGQPGGDT